ncbi:hypothetical protein DWF00_06805 [Bosea caraganae]|uniref:TY-Chap N-terminal domain-containing protein n=1 Tax=Bosea caraganae TaxID=2763117 RepID=A0A370L3Z5_9HYPH|nr:hypothetical protein [Bosea caraganae]RDJ23060.1 hypothetical protein DWE98_18050 [Bosea caraganae]RDJ28840.1 hypothetical protein DWF00_06805 [Bosea caraganae]
MIGVLALAAPAFGKERGLEAFLAAYHCEIAGRLAQIHADPRTQARYLILTDRDAPSHYVQCLLRDEPMLCEAASGFYGTKPGERRAQIVTKDGLAALQRLGFSTDGTEGNFQISVKATTQADFSAAAELMLTALYEGYSPRPGKRLKIDAPYGPGGRAMRAQCAPVS